MTNERTHTRRRRRSAAAAASRSTARISTARAQRCAVVAVANNPCARSLVRCSIACGAQRRCARLRRRPTFANSRRLMRRLVSARARGRRCPEFCAAHLLAAVDAQRRLLMCARALLPSVAKISTNRRSFASLTCAFRLFAILISEIISGVCFSVFNIL